MSWILKRGQTLLARGMHSACVVQAELGEGAQAQVYRVRIGNHDYALKWYLPEYLAVGDARIWERLRIAIGAGSPTEQYLWPFDFVSLPHAAQPGGYLMPIKPPEFISLADLMFGRCEPSFRALTTVAFQLAHSFLKLHASGLCYRDINFGNIFFNPATGDIRIADTDNVDVNLKPGAIMGTRGFMAPEVGRYEVAPNAGTDRYSLAVLLFHIFMIGHPLKGRRESELPYDVDDHDGSKRLCVDHPVFVFDPHDESNRPIPEVHGAMLSFWPIYPQSLRNLFIRSFTVGLRDPDARVMENEWRKEMSLLKDSIFVCGTCAAENFFDIERVKQRLPLNPCWSCGTPQSYPPRMRIGGMHGHQLVILSQGTKLYPHHLDGDIYNFSSTCAEVLTAPLSLRNGSSSTWTARLPGGQMVEVAPNATLPLADGCRIQFGRTEAEIKF